MPRKARITVPGHVHHVMTRGMEARPIFRSDSDREILKSLITKNITKAGYLLYAWCFMDNHYHLVIRINNYPLSLFMRSINGPYAQYFRKRIKTRGYLFQDRYKSIVCQDQNYLQELVRYVHLNPVRSGICKTIPSLRKYKWCGHSVLMGLQSWGAQNCSDVLNPTTTLKVKTNFVLVFFFYAIDMKYGFYTVSILPILMHCQYHTFVKVKLLLSRF